MRRIYGALVFMTVLMGLSNADAIPSFAPYDPIEAKKARDRLIAAGTNNLQTAEILHTQCLNSQTPPAQCPSDETHTQALRDKNKVVAAQHFLMARAYEAYLLIMEKAKSAQHNIAYRGMIEAMCGSSLFGRPKNDVEKLVPISSTVASKLCEQELNEIMTALKNNGESDAELERKARAFIKQVGLSEKDAQQVLMLARQQAQLPDLIKRGAA